MFLCVSARPLRQIVAQLIEPVVDVRRAGQHDAVERHAAADDEAADRIHGLRLPRIVEARVERRER